MGSHESTHGEEKQQITFTERTNGQMTARTTDGQHYDGVVFIRNRPNCKPRKYLTMNLEKKSAFPVKLVSSTRKHEIGKLVQVVDATADTFVGHEVGDYAIDSNARGDDTPRKKRRDP